MSSVADFVKRLAEVKPNNVVIGSKFTGRREYHWDSRTGVYSESMPLFHYHEWVLQQALMLEKRKRNARRHTK